jgi:hypothetical protein
VFVSVPRVIPRSVRPSGAGISATSSGGCGNTFCYKSLKQSSDIPISASTSEISITALAIKVVSWTSTTY